MTIIVRLSVVGRTSLAGGLDHVKLESVRVLVTLANSESFCREQVGNFLGRSTGRYVKGLEQ